MSLADCPGRMDTLKAYALSTAIVGAALFLTLTIPDVRKESPYLLLTLGVMVSANRGLGPGVFATLLSTLLAIYYFVPPLNSFAIASTDEVVPPLLFCLVGFSLTWISHRLRVSRETLLETNRTLRESEERYRKLAEETEVDRRELESLINSMNDGLVVVDSHGNPMMMNSAARRMHGYKDAAQASAPLEHVAGLFELRDASGNILPPERWPGSRALTGELIRNMEVEVLRRDTGKHFVGYYNAAPVRDQTGETKLAVVTITDITENKRIERRLRETQKMEGIGQLAGGIAHDFNNLLTGVIGNASLAQKLVPPRSPAIELLESVLKTGEQLAHLTRQMLAYSGKGRFVLELLDLSNLIVELKPLVQPAISKKIELRLELDPHLPPVEADKSQIQQVFMNLTMNAAEAIGSEAGLITVRTCLEVLDGRQTADLPPGKYVRLEIVDDGCGMDDEVKAKIFDPFFSTKFVGRGLGLAAVSGIVRGHKGAITVTTAPGKGTCFTVFFPAADGLSAASVGAAGKATSAERESILLVDDEEVVRDIAGKTLEQSGYEVFSVASGLAAVDIFRKHSGAIALVLLDLSMPGMGGEEVLPELRKIRPDIKVLVSSGYTEEETMRMFAGQQVSGFLQKPFTPDRLAEKVKSAIAG